MFVSAGTPAHLAQQALDAKLYKKDGQLRQALLRTTRTPEGCVVSVLTDEQRVLQGVCLIDQEGWVNVFVNAEHRGQRWGEKLVDMARFVCPKHRSELWAQPGNWFSASVRFWRKCGIQVMDFFDSVCMTSKETKAYKRDGYVLIHKTPERIHWDTLTSLYLAELYEPDSSDEGDGIRGHLSALIDYFAQPLIDVNAGPLCDYILFHIKEEFYSSGIVIERPNQVIELQLYVKPEYRRQGFGQQIIDTVKQTYPDREIWGYYTDSSRALLLRNGIKNKKEGVHE